MSAVRVLYVSSMPRSGSTLFGNILGQPEGFVHVGELNRLWFRLARSPSPCGCGLDLEACPLWSEVLAQLEAAPDYPGRRAMNEIQLAAQGLRGFAKQKVVSADPTYTSTITRLYEIVSSLVDGQIVVDSSKKVGYGALLASLPTLDVRYVHLLRDPRGIAASRARRLREDSNMLVRGRSLFADSVRWVVWNLAAESLGSPDEQRRVRYEDLTRDPRPEVERALSLFEPDIDVAPFFNGSAVQLATSHTVWGNRSRFSTGEVEIVGDDRWRSELGTWERRIATGLPRPLLGRYGYSGDVVDGPMIPS